MSNNVYQFADTILSGQSLGTGFALNGEHMVGIYMPAAWDAAALTFQGSLDGVTWQNLYDTANNEITWQAAAARYIVADPRLLCGLPFIRARSGTNAVPVNQTANRIITYRVRRYS